MSDKKTPLEDLLKSLEGHVVDSVEIRRENSHMIKKISSKVELDILHVRISAIPRTDVSHPKDLAFNIIGANDFHEVMTVILIELDKIGNSIKETLSESKKILPKLRKKKKPNTLSKLLYYIKGTIRETFRIRKPVEEAEPE